MANGVLENVDNFINNDQPVNFIQPVAVAPGPDGNYYLFYWAILPPPYLGRETLNYAVVDPRLDGGNGAVVRKGVPLAHTTQPRVTIVRHANNRDFWVLTYGTDGTYGVKEQGFQAFLLTKAGVQPAAVVSRAGLAAQPRLGGCELKAAPNGRLLASTGTIVGPGTATSYVCVYDFDNATGLVSRERLVRQLPPPFVPTQEYEVYSVSFSPNSQLLYTSEPTPGVDFANPSSRHRSGDVWQYDLTRATPAAIEQSRVKVSDVPVLTRPGNRAIGGHRRGRAATGSRWYAVGYAGPLSLPRRHDHGNNSTGRPRPSSGSPTRWGWAVGW